ncbi:hypothetical protein RI065_08460 [Mycoplasmatota bacterium zrk1]
MKRLLIILLLFLLVSCESTKNNYTDNIVESDGNYTGSVIFKVYDYDSNYPLRILLGPSSLNHHEAQYWVFFDDVEVGKDIMVGNQIEVSYSDIIDTGYKIAVGSGYRILNDDDDLVKLSGRITGGAVPNIVYLSCGGFLETGCESIWMELPNTDKLSWGDNITVFFDGEMVMKTRRSCTATAERYEMVPVLSDD